MDKIYEIYTILKKLEIKTKREEPMCKHTTFKIGGKAELFVTVNNISQLQEVLNLCKIHKTRYFILGNGSNLLVRDDGIKGVVISLNGEFKKVELLDENTIYCGAAATLAKLCNTALSAHLSGLEFAWGIPGTAGGAAYMNAGAYGGEMKDVIYSCSHITPNGETGKILSQHLNLGYRTSVYKENGYIITGIIVKLKRDVQKEISNRMEDYMKRRKDKQPLEYPSAGSVFKRPKGNYAGALIEQCGLKGKTIGYAQVSEKHSGFIINKGNATSKDVNELITYVQDTVKKETGIFLERELIIIGE